MDKSSTLGAIAALKETWNNLSTTQKLVVSGVAAISVVIVIIVSTIGARPSMSTLFSGLQSADAAAISDHLRDMKVPYELSEDGTLIKVPSNQVYDLRLKMATQKLPAGGTIGFEVFEKTSFGMSEFNQKVTYLQALQGELIRTISEFEQVEDARVNLSIPEDRLYADKKEDTKASVQLRLKQGMTLGDDQVAGIVRLVASSVEGLRPENVTVTDTNANVLSEGTGDADGLSARLSATQGRLKREYERLLQKDIQTMLDNIVGTGKAVVRVSARMNFDHKETTMETVAPNGESDRGILVSEETVDESYNGSAAKAKGSVNVTPVSPSAPKNSDYSHVERNNKYEVTKSTEHTITAPGKIDKLSVAVMLDQAVGQNKNVIRDTVKAAVGIDESRGDQIIVSSVPFSRSEDKAEAKAMSAVAKTDMIKTVAKGSAAIILLVVFLLFIRSLFKSIKFQPGQMARPSMESAENVVEKAYDDAATRAASSQAAAEGVVQDLAKNNPEEVANVVKAWMAE